MNRKVKTLFFQITILMISLWSALACSENKPFSAQGVVQGIQYGKDGYTAQLKGVDGQEFEAVISRVRLEKAYKELKTGEQVEVFGDTLHLDNKVRVLVTRIVP